MLMFLLFAIVLCVAVFVGVSFVRTRGWGSRADDLGTISERWLTEQRAASYDLHR